MALAIVVELGGCLLILFGLFTRPAAVALGVWCVATAVVAHSNWVDLNMKIHFLKNLAMAGGFVYLAAFGAGAYSLDAVLSHRRVSSNTERYGRAANLNQGSRRPSYSDRIRATARADMAPHAISGPRNFGCGQRGRYLTRH
jgi:hypothetical protein